MRVVLCTCPEDKATDIVKPLLNERLIACANIIPKIHSLYIWENKLCEDKEALIIMKTTATLINKLIKKVKTIHPYEVPEIIAIKENEVNTEYLNWVIEVTEK